MTTATAQATPRVARPQGVRVTGVLQHDAHAALSTGAQPHCFLILQIEPPMGLPYWAQMDLGTDVADHLRLEGLMPGLRRGALVSLAGNGSGLRSDHGRFVHTLTEPYGLILLKSTPVHPPVRHH